MFGGPDITGVSWADLWVYTPDSTCVNICNGLMASFSSANNICPGACINFTNQSFLANSYQWIFNGATPATSTDINPQNICYAAPGTYDVTLIASDSVNSDTLTLNNYITVFPFPAPQSINQVGDTLIAIAGSPFYQWYMNGTLIAGATDYFYVAMSNGNYNVITTDTNGCEVEAAINDVIASMVTFSYADDLGMMLFPNPVEDELEIRIEHSKIKNAEINIYNVLGLIVFSADIDERMVLDCERLPRGIYMLEVITSENKFRSKFIKQ